MFVIDLQPRAEVVVEELHCHKPAGAWFVFLYSDVPSAMSWHFRHLRPRSCDKIHPFSTFPRQLPNRISRKFLSLPFNHTQLVDSIPESSPGERVQYAGSIDLSIVELKPSISISSAKGLKWPYHTSANFFWKAKGGKIQSMGLVYSEEDELEW